MIDFEEAQLVTAEAVSLIEVSLGRQTVTYLKIFMNPDLRGEYVKTFFHFLTNGDNDGPLKNKLPLSEVKLAVAITEKAVDNVDLTQTIRKQKVKDLFEADNIISRTNVRLEQMKEALKTNPVTETSRQTGRPQF